jgi:ABC-type transporter MlaC component
MRLRTPTLRFLAAPLLACALSASMPMPAYAAGDPQEFVQREHEKLQGLLHQPKTGARDSQVQRELDGMVDYDELARRAFGQPCPAAIPGCTNHWGELSPAQQSEVSGLLKQLVVKNYQKNLEKTLDYDVTYKGSKVVDSTDTRVRTEAKSKTKPRDPAVLVDYVVQVTAGRLRIVDIVTEGSSLTKNYYDQFDKKLKNPAEGYANIVQKLRDKIAQP